MKAFVKIVILATLVYFFSWFAVYKTGLNELAIQSEDTLPAIFIPVAIIKEGTIYLDSYYDMFLENYPHPDDKDYERGLVPFYLRKVTAKEECAMIQKCVYQEVDHYVSAFPIITPLLAVPVYFFPVILGVPINFETVTVLAHISAAFIVAISGGFLYLLLNKHFFFEEQEGDVPLLKQKSFLLTMVYLFATINYAQISQALWQHGTVQLFTILALWAIFEKRHVLTGLSFGLMLLSRPTSGIAVVFIGLLLLNNFLALEKASIKQVIVASWIERKSVFKLGLKVLVGLIPPVLFFLWYNNSFYGNIANQGYSNQIFTEWKGRFPEGFLGLWLSPSKGILIYSPVFIFSLYGIYLGLKNSKNPLQYLLYGLVVLVHTLVLGKWKHWYGGYSFGYRMASDIIPFLVLLLVPFVKSLVFSQFRPIFLFFIGLSILIQMHGIVFFDGIWHGIYDRGYSNTGWLWSVRNSELVFNFRRVLVKLGWKNSIF